MSGSPYSLEVRYTIGPTVKGDRWDRTQEVKLEVDLQRPLTPTEIRLWANVIDHLERWVVVVRSNGQPRPDSTEPPADHPTPAAMAAPGPSAPFPIIRRTDPMTADITLEPDDAAEGAP